MSGCRNPRRSPFGVEKETDFSADRMRFLVFGLGGEETAAVRVGK